MLAVLVGWIVTVEPLPPAAACGEPRAGEAVLGEETLSVPADEAEADHLDAYDPRVFVIGQDGAVVARVVCLEGRTGRLQVRIEGGGPADALAARLVEIAEEAWVDPHPSRARLSDAQLHVHVARPQTPAVFDGVGGAGSLRFGIRELRRPRTGYYIGSELEFGLAPRAAVVGLAVAVGASMRSGTNAVGAGVTIGAGGVPPGRVPMGVEGGLEVYAVGDVGGARLAAVVRAIGVGGERLAARQDGSVLPVADELHGFVVASFARRLSIGLSYKEQMGDRWFGVMVGVASMEWR